MKSNKTKKPKQFVPKDLDLLALQSYPYKIRYIESNSPSATEMTSSCVTRNGQNLKKSDYAKLLDKQYGKNR